MDIYIPEPKKGDRHLPTQKDSLEPTVYQKAHREAIRITKELGLDFEDSKQYMKEYIFQLKKTDEENAR